MEHPFLTNMLFASSIVMYAYGLLSFLTFSPEGDEYYNYRVAKKLFGSFMVFVATCLLMHWYFDLRNQNPLLATSLCLFYFTPGSMIFSVIFSSLIQPNYHFSKRLKQITIFSICLAGMLAINYFFVPQGSHNIAFIIAALLFIITAIISIVRFYKLYRKTLEKANDYYSDNIGKLLKWIPITLYMTILLAFAISIISIISNVSIIPLFLFMGLSIYTSIYISLQNHMMNIAKMKLLLSTNDCESLSDSIGQSNSESFEDETRDNKTIKLRLKEWQENKGFTKHGLTIDELAIELNTNRTYLSSYINAVYNLTFRGWIASLRIEYSKELLLQDEELPSITIANMIGYSPNAYIRTFTKAEDMTPVQWRNENRTIEER
ncbi:MAG: AraC family transcriptional regulator [Rikenellaceae bacterium]